MGYNEDNQKREWPALLGYAHPVDLLNTLLSFTYTLLVHNCAAALEARTGPRCRLPPTG